MPAQAANVIRRYWLWGLCYFLFGAVASTAVAWAISCPDWKTTDFQWSGMVLERGGRRWYAKAGNARGRALMHFLAEPDLARAQAELDYDRSERRLAKMPMALATSVPHWGLDAIDSFDSILPNGTTQYIVGLQASGWPRVCGRLALIDGPGYSGPHWHGVYKLRGKYEVPVTPIWGGLILDSLFYGAIPLGLHVGVRAGVRLRRRAKGRCPSCGYDRRGLAADAKCPECGTVPMPTQA